MKNNGGAAFPTITEGSECGIKYLNYIPGMTLRQFYKAAALIKFTISDEILRDFKPEYAKTFCDNLAKMSGMVADALIAEDMIAEREK